MRGVVLDVETRLDRAALAASGRTRAPVDMPAALQVVTAAATLEFARDPAGDLVDLRLQGVADRDGEGALAAAVDRTLASLYAVGGHLVTYNGSHDLGILRFALLRARLLGGGGVAAWLRANPDRHRDVMREIACGGRHARLADVAAGLGLAAGPACLAAADAGGVVEKAELDVCLTMMVLLHLDAEAGGSRARLARDLLAFGRFLVKRSVGAPHLAPLLRSPVYARASSTLAG